MKTRRQATYVQPTDLVTTHRAQSPVGFINVRQNLAVNEYGEYGGPFTSFVDDNFSGLRHFISTCKDSRCKTCPRLFYKYIYKYFHSTGAQLGEGGRPPCPFLKIKKSALILEKNALIVSILRLNLPFKL